MEDAVTTECGHTFSEETLKDWLQRNPRCPMCHKELCTPPKLIVNHLVRRAVKRYNTTGKLSSSSDSDQVSQTPKKGLSKKGKNWFRNGSTKCNAHLIMNLERSFRSLKQGKTKKKTVLLRWDGLTYYIMGSGYAYTYNLDKKEGIILTRGRRTTERFAKIKDRATKRIEKLKLNMEQEQKEKQNAKAARKAAKQAESCKPPPAANPGKEKVGMKNKFRRRTSSFALFRKKT